MPQAARKRKEAETLHRNVSTPVVILAAVILLAFLVFMIDRFITPVVPRTSRMSEEEAWQKRLKEMQQAMPQGGWASPAPGMPPVYVPPAGQSTQNIPPPR